MSKFNIRTISQLMVTDPKNWAKVLAELTRSFPFGVKTYGPAIHLIRKSLRGQPMEKLLADYFERAESIGLKVFRVKSIPKICWVQQNVAPHIRKHLGTLEGCGRKANTAFVIEGQVIAGGPHFLVEWDDGSQRLVYLLMTKWSQKRVRAFQTLLELYAMIVLNMVPATVVLVDVPRQTILYGKDLEAGEVALVRSTVRSYKRYVDDRGSA